MKKILCGIIASIILITFLLPCSIAAVDNSDNFASLDNTSVVDDLKYSFMDIDGKFPKDSSDDGMYLIKFVEQGYEELSGIDSENFGLYLYVYNPSGKALIGSVDKVQFATRWSKDNSGVIKALDYSKYALSKVDANETNTLIKFKVSRPDLKIMLRYDNMRRYDISGFEIQSESLGDIRDYSVGTTYTFSGYAKGLSTESKDKSTLACICDQLTTISVDVHQVSYLTENSSLGVGYSNQVNSVYFSLPKDIEARYGDLYSVKYEYNHYYTSPIIVTNNTETYNIFDDYIGKPVDDPYKFKYEIVAGDFWQAYGQKYYNYTFSFGRKNKNVTLMSKPAQTYNYDNAIVPSCLTTFIKNLDYEGNWEYGDVVVKAEDLESYFKNYTASYYTGKELGYSADLFDLSKSNKYVVETKNINDRFNLEGYADAKGYNVFWLWLNYGFVDEKEFEGIKNIKYIEKIASGEIFLSENFEKELLVDDVYKKEFSEFYNKSLANKENVYILRYAYSPDYYSQKCYVNSVTTASTGYNEAETIDNVLMCQGNVYLNFDIIQFSFMDHKGNETIIPVVSDPTNGSFKVTVTDPDRDVGDLVVDILNGEGNDDPKFNLFLIIALIAIIIIVAIVVIVVCCIYVPGFGKGLLKLLMQFLDVLWTRLKLLGAKIKNSLAKGVKSFEKSFDDYIKQLKEKKPKKQKKQKKKTSKPKSFRRTKDYKSSKGTNTKTSYQRKKSFSNNQKYHKKK